MIILLGAPGSGKGTQSRLLAECDNYEIFSVGEVLRREIAYQTECGKAVEAALARGEFASLDIVIDLLHSYVKDENIILDGFPRNIDQAVEFEKFIKSRSCLAWGKNIHVFDFLLDDASLKERLLDRRICSMCDAALLKNSHECRFCCHVAEDAYIRDDDNQEAIERRLKLFHEETEPLRGFFAEKGAYHPIHANNDVEEVYAQIKKILDKKL